MGFAKIPINSLTIKQYKNFEILLGYAQYPNKTFFGYPEDVMLCGKCMKKISFLRESSHLHLLNYDSPIKGLFYNTSWIIKLWKPDLLTISVSQQ